MSTLSPPSSSTMWRSISSSSVRLKVQVLYIRKPPGFSVCHTFSIISRCRAAHCDTRPSLHCRRASSSLRIIPSPEQGASTATMSKARCILRNTFVSPQHTAALGAPHLLMFSLRIFAREGTNSLATTKASSDRAPRAAVVFPPGAAQLSR